MLAIIVCLKEIHKVLIIIWTTKGSYMSLVWIQNKHVVMSVIILSTFIFQGQPWWDEKPMKQDFISTIIMSYNWVCVMLLLFLVFLTVAVELMAYERFINLHHACVHKSKHFPWRVATSFSFIHCAHIYIQTHTQKLKWTCKYAHSQGAQLQSLITYSFTVSVFLLAVDQLWLLIFSVVFAHFLAEIIGCNQVSVWMKL